MVFINSGERLYSNYFQQGHLKIFEGGYIQTFKVYTLQVEKEEHDILVVEISSCHGSYEVSITDVLENAGSFTSDKDLEIFEQKKDGKRVIYVHNLKSSVYYLTVRAKMPDFICQLKYKYMNRNKKNKINNLQNNNQTKQELPKQCGNNLAYLMYYYSTKKKGLLFTSEKVRFLTHYPYGNGKIKIKIPSIIKKDILENNKTIEDYRFDVFATKNEEYFDRMGSVCFLSQFKEQSEDTIFKVKDVTHEGGKFLVISGLGYRTKYYINILAQSTTSKELIAFHPFVMWTGGYLPFPIWKIGLASNVIILYMRNMDSYRDMKSIFLKENKENKMPIIYFEKSIFSKI